MRVDAVVCLARARSWSGRAAPALIVLLTGVVLTLAGCGSTPKGAATGASTSRDGPAAETPADLARTPDAEPQLESIRPGGPNKPYEVLGKNYTPETRDVPLRETGLASWYGRKFHGRKTASGELYNMHAMTAAHKTMPLPSYARVRNPANGREVVVRVNDRGPFVAGRVIDLSYTAALKLDLLRGLGRVEVERITFEDIRTGAWRRGAAEPGATASAATASAAAPLPNADSSPRGAAPVPANVLARETGAPTATTTPSGAPSPGSDTAVAAASPPEARTQTSRALTAGARGYWVQLGAFRERSGAEDFLQRVAVELDWLAPLMAVFSDAPLWRLQAGPYPSREDAQSAAQRVREGLQLVPVIVEKR